MPFAQARGRAPTGSLTIMLVMGSSIVIETAASNDLLLFSRTEKMSDSSAPPVWATGVANLFSSSLNCGAGDEGEREGDINESSHAITAVNSMQSHLESRENHDDETDGR